MRRKVHVKINDIIIQCGGMEWTSMVNKVFHLLIVSKQKNHKHIIKYNTFLKATFIV